MEALRHANRPSEHLRALQQSALLLSFKGGEEGWALTDSRNHYNLLRGGGGLPRAACLSGNQLGIKGSLRLNMIE